MSESPLIKKLQRIVNEWKKDDKRHDLIINRLKEELQYYVLNFVYNHPRYRRLVMYGGTLLRIGYELPRISEDLDFQTNEDINTEELKQEIIKHFLNAYNLRITVTGNPRPTSKTHMLKINFDILKYFDLSDIPWTTLRIRFDINFFSKTNNFIKENIPIVHDSLVFQILTYPLATLMASKIVAVLKRTMRGMGQETAPCKPRDIYDLQWYLERKIIPDMEYLKAQTVNFHTIRELFDVIERRVVNLHLKENIIEQDMAYLFADRTDLDLGFKNNWRTKIPELMKSYKMFTVDELDAIRMVTEFSTDARCIHYDFLDTQKKTIVKFTVKLSSFWFKWNDLKIQGGGRNQKIEQKITFPEELKELDYWYINLFYDKIQDFIRRNKNVLMNDRFETKFIRPIVDEAMHPEKEIFVNRSLLQTIRFEELI